MATTHEFSVAMTCGACEKAVRRVLEKASNGEAKVDVDLGARKVFVTSMFFPRPTPSSATKTTPLTTRRALQHSRSSTTVAWI